MNPGSRSPIQLMRQWRTPPICFRRSKNWQTMENFWTPW
ncbi:conserved hypothetical protein, partial [delta proteobacterium NaphS2]